MMTVGKDYKYVAEYADRRRRKGVTSCRTLKRKVKSRSKGAKKHEHDFDMMFDMGGNKWNIVTISLYMKNSQHAIELSALHIWCHAMRAQKVPQIT